MSQSIQVAANAKYHRAASPSVTTVGTAARNVLLTPKMDRPRTAIAGRNFKSRLVDEVLHLFCAYDSACCVATGSIETIFFPRFTPNKT